MYLSYPVRMTLPPGQHAIEGFPRFGTHLHQPPPPVPPDPVLAVSGAVTAPFEIPLGDLATLPRRELTADFHCVAGWSATGLRWEGVAFADLYREMIGPAVRPGAPVTHIVFGGLDGYRPSLTIEDALAGDVLIAERLDGRPLDAEHGAPARLVSPRQYGYLNTKHLCRIELHTAAPSPDYGVSRLSRVGLRLLWFRHHPRARVWEEERHRHLPPKLVRPLYRPLIAPIMILSRRR
jgi:DMSO/TMAO reductase YedYZ molybdopterin-dependent catalytic subunit